MRRAHAAFGREWSGAPPGAAREWSRARTPSRPFQSSQKNGTAREDTPEPERRGDRAERRCTCGAPGPEILHGCVKAGLGQCAGPAFVVAKSFADEAPMAKEEAIEIDGIVKDVLPNTTFRVHLANGHDVLATIAGKMRRFRIRVLAGDRVTLALSPYDLTRGRITFRHK